MTRWTIWLTIPDILPQPMFLTIPFAAWGLCHHRYPLRVKSYARPPNLGSFCPLSVSCCKKMGKKDENLAHFCEQNFTHACLHTLHWPHNLCDAAIRHGILFPRLSSTNNVFFQWFPEGLHAICTLSYENIVCTTIFEKFSKFALPRVLCAHASCALSSDSYQVNYMSWGGSISNFKRIGQEMCSQ